MIKVRINAGTVPQNWTPYGTSDFMTFQREAQTAGANASVFWQTVAANPYQLGQIQDPVNIRRMQRKYNEKHQRHGQATLKRGRVGPHAIVIISSAGTNDYAYIFYASSEAELSGVTEGTFNFG